MISREFAPELVLKRLRFFRDSPQGPEPDATGYKGFYYHFLDMETGRRVWKCELSTIDSAFLFAGMLTCAAYFDGDTEDEAEVRRLADELYRRADWQWATNGGADDHATAGSPETGFIPAPLDRVRRGAAALPARPGLADASRCRRRATPPTAPPTSGRRSTAASCSTPGRCSRTSSRTSGSTSAASGTPSCASTAATTSRTAGRRPTCSRSTRVRNPLEFVGYGEYCWGFTATATARAGSSGW